MSLVLVFISKINHRSSKRTRFCLSFLDEILIVSAIKGKRKSHLNIVSERLNEYGLGVMNPNHKLDVPNYNFWDI